MNQPDEPIDEFVFVKDEGLFKKSLEIEKEFKEKYPNYDINFDRIDGGAIHISYEKLDGGNITDEDVKEMQDHMFSLFEKYKVV